MNALRTRKRRTNHLVERGAGSSTASKDAPTRVAKKPPPVTTREGLLNRLGQIAEDADKPAEKISAMKQIADLLGIQAWQSVDDIRKLSQEDLHRAAVDLVKPVLRRLAIKALDEKCTRRALVSMREGWVPGIAGMTITDLDVAAKGLKDTLFGFEDKRGKR